MLCFQSKNNDPYYNLATEEYLLKNRTDDVFMLWQSMPVVVVGKHQNTLSEINYRYIRNKGISIARRLTGGGAVYHDSGNINFTFIHQGEPGKLVNFAGFIEPVTGFLATLGVKAIRGQKNEILVNGIKISGNAEHVYKNRVLHHGTLLFNTDLNVLRESINRRDGVYADKAVKSNRSHVMNLTECIDPGIRMADFQRALMDYMLKNYQGSLFEPEMSHEQAIRQLAVEKYNTWEWIFGWSPDYEFRNHWHVNNYDITLVLASHRGLITACSLQSQVFPLKLTEVVSEKLTGIHHKEIEIRKTLEASDFGLMLDKQELEDLVFAFF